MITQTQGKMFLASERGLNQLDWFRSFNSFNFGNQASEHKKPFGALYVLNDDTLAGSHRLTLNVDEDSDILLMPLVGEIVYQDSLGNRTSLEAGQCQFFPTPAGTTIEIKNPYENELVNFLQCRLKRPAVIKDSVPRICSFNIDEQKNELIGLCAAPKEKDGGASGFIGKYDGRAEDTYHISNQHNGVYFFVIEGAFEVANRLLEARDGLALWDVHEVEFEALSNDAIVFIIEVELGGRS